MMKLCRSRFEMFQSDNAHAIDKKPQITLFCQPGREKPHGSGHASVDLMIEKDTVTCYCTFTNFLGSACKLEKSKRNQVSFET